MCLHCVATAGINFRPSRIDLGDWGEAGATVGWRLRKPASPDHAAGTVYSGDPTERWVSFKPVLTLHNLRRQDRARALD
jgi:hypothetical protein